MNSLDVTGHYQAIVASPLPGKPNLGLRVQGGLKAIDVLGKEWEPFVTEDEGVAIAVKCLQNYFLDGSCPRELELLPEGTPFQQRVWEQLRRIPSGQAVRYGELASKLSSSARAVANACRANPIPVLIPCHRVIAATGLGGYMGETAGSALDIKYWLLHHEGYV